MLSGLGFGVVPGPASSSFAEPPVRKPDPFPKPAFAPDAVLVAFREAQPLAARRSVIDRLGLTPDRRVRSPFFVRLRLPRGVTVDETVRALRRDPAVRIAEPDWIVHTAQWFPNDPKFPQLYGLHNTGQTGGTADADIDAPEAWSRSRGATQTIVAVIDTGVFANHPDLAANILKDAQGKVVGYDYYSFDADPNDETGHGTHVAGIVGAVGNNGIGVIGVCPIVRIMPLRFIGPDGGAISSAILATDFAREHGANVINNSWGGGGFSDLLKEAIERCRDANLVYVAAAGNSGASLDTGTFYPASYNRYVDNIVVVGATDHNDLIAPFSNYGTTVDLAAPGKDVLSTVPPSLDTDGTPDGYQMYYGTSMAAPLVSGTAALIVTRFPGLPYLRIKDRLLQTADRSDVYVGKVATGRLNAFAALEVDDIPPAPPKNLRVFAITPSTVQLRFAQSGDDGDVGRAARYEVRTASNPISPDGFGLAAPAGIALPNLTVPDVRASVSNLTPGQTVFVAVRAVDNVGNVSEPVSFGPIATAPAFWQDQVESLPRFTAGAGTKWAITEEAWQSPTHAWTDSPGEPYSHNANSALTLTTPMRINGPVALRFAAKLSLEASYDYVYVEASGNGGAWTRLLALTGLTDWKTYSVPMVQYQGQDVRFRFRLVSDATVAYEGIWIDDLYVVPYLQAYRDDVEGSPRFVGDAPWATTTTQRYSPVRSWTDSPSGNYANGIDIGLTGTNTIDVSNLADPQVVVWTKAVLERNYDFLRVRADVDGSGFALKGSFTGTTEWAPLIFPIGPASTVKLQFRLQTDLNFGYDGVYLDDIGILGEEILTAPTCQVSGQLRFSGLAAGATPPTGVWFETRPQGSTAGWMRVWASVAGDGSFDLTVPRGLYDVAVQGAPWLRKVSPVNATGETAGSLDWTLRNGDVSGDNRVNITDFLLFRAAFGASPASATWNPRADLNRDGTVSTADFLLLRTALGATGDA
ncbi:MAG: S8 family serine peptidase [Fimbriimonadaceae bacterium]|nr:S8 family serine peptidase [Fimbriimonadaceae bacterium]